MTEIILASFDPAAAKRLKPGESIAFAEAAGLRLVRSGKGHAWVYRYRSPVDHALRQIKLGDWPRMPAHRAVDEWQTRRTERDTGRDPAKELREQRKRIREQPRAGTVAEVVDVHLDVLGQVNPKTKASRRTEKGQKEVRRMFDVDLPPIENRKAAEITIADAATFLKRIRDRGAPDIARRLRAELAAAWRTAQAHGLLHAGVLNPWPDALKGELAQGERDRALAPGEIRALMGFLPSYTTSVADALELSLRTGLRTGEVVALRSKWFAESDNVLWCEIPAQHMKMRRPHRIPFVGRARAIAEARMVGEFLFPSPRGEHLTQKALGVAVHFHSPASKTRPKVERPRCPVENWTPHDLRRTAATLLGDLRCPFEIIEAIQAHRLPGVAGRYQRSEHADAKVEWLGKLNVHLDTIATSETVRHLPRRKSAA